MTKFMDIRFVAVTSVFAVFFLTAFVNVFWANTFGEWHGEDRYRFLTLTSQNLISVTNLDSNGILSPTKRVVKLKENLALSIDFNFNNQELGVVFQDLGWNKGLVADTLLASIPPAIQYIEPVRKRKRLFIGIVMPIVVHSLGKVLRTRAFLLDLLGENPSSDEKKRIEGLCKIYRIKSNCDVEKLLLRVDVLPISLILAQAAIESGWGSSRFAQEGNALFGQWTTSKDKGLVPESREEGRSHKVKSYADLEASVDSYLRNLNSHPVYKGMRLAREEFRKSNPHQQATNKTFQGEYLADVGVIWELLPHLEAYSEKGEQYIELLTSVIRDNQLLRLDRLLADFVE